MPMSGCRVCDYYNRGAGSKHCFKCPKYKEVVSQFTDRETIRVVHYPSAIMEEVADRSHEGKGMLWAIRKLEPQDMAIALLKFYGELSVRDMAAGLNLSPRFIFYRLKDIRAQMKIILSDENSRCWEEEPK